MSACVDWLSDVMWLFDADEELEMDEDAPPAYTSLGGNGGEDAPPIYRSLGAALPTKRDIPPKLAHMVKVGCLKVRWRCLLNAHAYRYRRPCLSGADR